MKKHTKQFRPLHHDSEPEPLVIDLSRIKNEGTRIEGDALTPEAVISVFSLLPHPDEFAVTIEPHRVVKVWTEPRKHFLAVAALTDANHPAVEFWGHDATATTPQPVEQFLVGRPPGASYWTVMRRSDIERYKAGEIEGVPAYLMAGVGSFSLVPDLVQ